MLEVMAYESFYHGGHYDDARLGIYCAWVGQPVSIVGEQPLVSETGKTVLLMCGEYSYDADSGDVSGSGRNIASLYEEYGEQFFRRLNGTFSGLLIDRARGCAYLFNDRYRLQRIYWYEEKESFYFASEAKALLRVLPQLRRFDRQGVAEFLRFGCTRGSRTLFADVSILPAASLWCFDSARNKKQEYFSVSSWEGQAAVTPGDFIEEFEMTFKAILPRYYQPGADVGISLTAGLDGRVIMACLPSEGACSVCYTFAGKEGGLLDARIAARVAAACGIEHNVLQLEPDFLAEFADHADQTVYLTDGCLGPIGAHEVYFNRKARALAPIRLTGVFGGEILRGISFSQPNGLDREVLGAEYSALVDEIDGSHFSPATHPVTSAILSEIPERRFGVVAAGRSQTVFRTPYLDNKLVALAYQMPSQLRASTGPQVSIVKRNNDKLNAIPTDMGLLGEEWPLFSWMRRIHGRITFKLDYFYTEGFPGPLRQPLESVVQRLGARGQLIGRHKFLRYRHWFRTDLADYVCDRLMGASKRQPQIWNPACLRRIGEEIHAAQTKRNWTHEINLILTLEAVERQLFSSGTANVKSPIALTLKTGEAFDDETMPEKVI